MSWIKSKKIIFDNLILQVWKLGAFDLIWLKIDRIEKFLNITFLKNELFKSEKKN